MKDTEEAYLGGVLDSVARFRIHIQEDSSKFGYKAYPECFVTRGGSQKLVFGMMHQYCENHSIKYRLDNRKGDTERFVIRDSSDIQRFLEPFVDHFVQQYERALLFLDKAIPIIEEGEHLSKQGMFELSQIAHSMYEDDPSINRFKHDPEYFLDEWGDQLDYA